MILNFRIVASQDLIHEEDGKNIYIKEYFIYLLIKKIKITGKKREMHAQKSMNQSNAFKLLSNIKNYCLYGRNVI